MTPQKSQNEQGRRERYKDLSGHSGIVHFKISKKSIEVEFQDGAVYLYDDITPGRVHVEQMKKLALAGRGLNSYISTYVRKNYARKLN